MRRSWRPEQFWNNGTAFNLAIVSERLMDRTISDRAPQREAAAARASRHEPEDRAGRAGAVVVPGPADHDPAAGGGHRVQVREVLQGEPMAVQREERLPVVRVGRGSGPNVSVPRAPRRARTPVSISHRTAAFEKPGWLNRAPGWPQL